MRTIAIIIISVLFSAFQLKAEQSYSMTYEFKYTSEDSETQEFMELFGSRSMKIFHTPDFHTIDWNMGMMGTWKFVHNLKTKEVLVLVESVLYKLAAMTTKEELNGSENEAQENVSEVQPKIIYTKQNKKIGQFNCHEALITDIDGQESQVWYTKEIKINVDNDDYLSFAKNLEGTVIQMVSTVDGLTTELTCTEFLKSVENPASVFSFEIPAGYELKKNFEELINAQSGE